MKPGYTPIMSRRNFRKMIIPKIGDEVKCESGSFGKITYVNDGKLRITAIGQAKMDEIIALDMRLFKVDRVEDKKWNATFIGFKNNPEVPITPAPDSGDEAAVKVLD